MYSPSDTALSIVIPAYNEAARIGPSLERVVAFARARAEPCEIIVVDDGSRDDTRAIVGAIAEEHACLRLLALPQNRGKGAAVRAGVLASRGRHVLFTDADLSTPIDELARLESALADGADIAIGSRAVPGARARPCAAFYSPFSRSNLPGRARVKCKR